MDSVVPAEITAELTQILSNLVLGDNEIRSNAEKAVNERLAHTPELYLLALAQFAITADTEVSSSARLLFRPSPSPPQPPTHPPAPKLTLYDHLSSNTLTTLENLLLHSLSNELSPLVRKKTVDTACDLANESMKRGRPWHALQAQVFGMAQAHSSSSGGAGEGGEGGGGREVKLRESAVWVFAGCPNLLLDLQVDSVVGVLRGGLGDGESVEVRHAALQASVTYLTSADTLQLSQSTPTLLPSMLSTLPELARNLSTQKNIVHLTNFLSTLTPLCSTHPTLFKPHIQLLLSFLPSIVMPHFDSGKTPTVHRPYSGFEFPPPQQEDGEEDEDEERKTLRLTAMEFIVSLSEARPGMVKGAPGWVENGVRACLEGMSEVEEDEGWVGEDPSTGSNEDSPAALYEQSLDRLACALGGKAVLPPAFQYIPSMLLSYEWRSRHAGLMAIAAIAEGTGKVMKNELGKIVEMVVPMFRDSHPRVRYAACQCVGQLCTDLEEVIQAEYHQQLFNVLIPALEDAEPRVHAHAAAALINFCEGVVRETLLPYLDPIVERLLKLLNPPNGEVRRYVQEQAITTLAMVADASEATFAKHYPTIMPLLLNVLRNADGPEYRKLRVKAMECAGLIAIAVGREVFRPDSGTLIELLIRIQKSPVDPQDTQLGHYLIATWAKVCQALGPEFEPYLPVVMPTLLATASAKADISVYDEDAEEERDGWETISMDGQTLGIRTSAIEEKCQAFETLVIYCSTLGAKFAPHLAQTLEVTLPSLKFYFHDGVREACAILIPMLLVCGKNSNTLTPQMLSATFTQLITCINSEHDISFLASLYKCFTDSLRVIGGAQSLTPEFQQGIITATNRQLQQMADKRRTRANRANNGEYEVDKEEMALLEEIEEFALEDMDKMLAEMDANHPLRVAISGVRDLGFNTWDSEEEGDEEG